MLNTVVHSHNPLAVYEKRKPNGFLKNNECDKQIKVFILIRPLIDYYLNELLH